jgi:predicted nucleic-acid-binding Zn-ribbon protein
MQSRIWIVLLLGLLLPAATADNPPVESTKVGTQTGGINTATTPAARNCPKCQSEMEQGHLFKTNADNTYPIYWVQGAPKRFRLGGEVGVLQYLWAFRCKSCGYTELYTGDYYPSPLSPKKAKRKKP